MGDGELAASLHRRLTEVEARLLLEEQRLAAATTEAPQREDAERRMAGWRRERDELRGLLAELRHRP